MNNFSNSSVDSQQEDNCEIFDWSPLPQRKWLQFTENNKEDSTSGTKEQEENSETEATKHLYPNCDGNVWLRSCKSEIKEPLEGVVMGRIPNFLNGSLYRNGPGSLEAGNDRFQHLFDCSALIHKFSINSGRVWYQCRFLESEVFKRNRSANRIVFNEFGTHASVPDPCLTIFHNIATLFTPSKLCSDNSMISVYPIGDSLYAFGEIPVIHQIDPSTLRTVHRVDVSKYVKVINHTSHPHILQNGTVFNLGMTVGPLGLYHNIVCFPASAIDSLHTSTQSEQMLKAAHIVASLPSRWLFHPSYMHTFGITDQFFVVVEQPLSLSVSAILMNKVKNKPLAGCFRWYQDQLTRITLLNRTTGRTAYRFYAQSFFYLHIINQYEHNNHVVLDICIYRDPAMLDCMYIDALRNMQRNPDYAKMFRSRPVRFVLPLNVAPKSSPNLPTGNLVQLENTNARAFYLTNGDIFVIPERLSQLGCETPRINYERHLGKWYRYFYAISADVDATNPGTIIKVDTLNKTAKTWSEPNCYPSEPIFVANPHSKMEDDGVILSALVWGRNMTNRVGLLVLDATTFAELGRAEFETPGPIPKCLHGWFLPSQQSKATK